MSGVEEPHIAINPLWHLPVKFFVETQFINSVNNSIAANVRFFCSSQEACCPQGSTPVMLPQFCGAAALLPMLH